ncbi:aldolase/citrate lyase family protein [Bacteroidota bacterium]
MNKMITRIATAGEKGEDIRSDCYCHLELLDSGGNDIKLKSKVEKLFGDDIRKMVTDILSFFSIENVRLYIEDSGALTFVISARIEAAIKKIISTKLEYLPEFLSNNSSATLKDTNRFSRLYLPGNTPRLMINAGVHKPNGMILDLEDSVAHNKKHDARYLVRNALRQLNFYDAERMVRINQVPNGLDDLDFVIPHYVNLVLIPKCEGVEQIILVNQKIDEIKKSCKIIHPVWLMPIVESALGVVKAFEIANAAENVVALAIGLEDYTADIGANRSDEGTESFFARSQIVNAARAAGIQPIDSVFSDVADIEGLKKNVLTSKSLGFDGMGCIHPRQIKVIHENFAPLKTEIEKAMKIVLAFEDAQSKGLGVVSLGTKMIDPPVVKRAQKTIELAISLGKLNTDWRKEL